MPFYGTKNHEIFVEQLATQVRKFHASKTPFRINHGSSNSTRVREAGTPELHIAHLKNILSIDTTSKVAVVEPNVALDELVAATFPLGLLPPVVMEFPGITVGGGFSGASGESSSWAEGTFDCVVTSIEVVLGNGDIVTAEKDGNNADLFTMARCSLGTVGVITQLTLRLVPAKPYIQAAYHHTTSYQETLERTGSLCEAEYAKKNSPAGAQLDFIEAIQYSPTHGVIITGKFSSFSEGLSTTRFDRAQDPWFYKHAEATTPDHTELIPTQSYLFRHDRGGFWSASSFFNYLRLQPTRFWRWVFNPAMKTRAIYKSQQLAGGPGVNIVQDLVLPVPTSREFAEWVDKETGIWPIWICPLRGGPKDVWGQPYWHSVPSSSSTSTGDSSNASSFSSPTAAGNGHVRQRHSEKTAKDALYFNFGVWGKGPNDPSQFVSLNRRMESTLRHLHGMKVLYAESFYTEEEFWSLYDKQAYDAARKKWHATALPTVYDKVKRRTINAEDEDEEESFWERLLWNFLNIRPLGGIAAALYAAWVTRR
ncbi:unnamed protein product [Periconia digitata]|uniref:Delta(24)-sterol reductase n=1 Tax=Periconia digitata TaxID=1303443 RepID=A0A9W4U2X7_9PLEO|nr:unnamed protein product [Periconia digitata]